MTYKDTISKNVREGVKQLDQSARLSSDYRLLWISTGSEDFELERDQIESTLCGRAYLYSPDRDHLLECYFFSESEFFTNRQGLDGVVISYPGGWKLILNPLSPRFEAFAQSEFVRSLGAAGWNPIEQEKRGQLMLADCEHPRSRSDLVIQYLSEKYGIRLNVIPIVRIGGRIVSN